MQQQNWEKLYCNDYNTTALITSAVCLSPIYTGHDFPVITLPRMKYVYMTGNALVSGINNSYGMASSLKPHVMDKSPYSGRIFRNMLQGFILYLPET